jgi:hypothetical protein
VFFTGSAFFRQRCLNLFPAVSPNNKFNEKMTRQFHQIIFFCGWLFALFFMPAAPLPALAQAGMAEYKKSHARDTATQTNLAACYANGLA